MKYLLSLLLPLTLVNGLSAQQVIPIDQYAFPKTQIGNPFGSSPILQAEGGQMWWAHMVDFHRNYSRAMGEWLIHDLNGIGGVSDSLLLGGDARVISMDHNSNVPAMLAVQVAYLDSLRIRQYLVQKPGFHKAVLIHFPATGWQIMWDQADSIVDILIDDQGDLVFLSRQALTQSTTLFKTDLGGQILQSKSLPDLGFLDEIELMKDGALTISGRCADPYFSLDGVSDTLHNLYNAYALRLNKHWTATWIRHWDDISCSKVETAALSDGRVAVLGNMLIDSDMGDLHFDGPAPANSDFALMVLDSAGQGQWIAEVPSDTGWVSAILDEHSWSLFAQDDIIQLSIQHKGDPIYGIQPYANFNSLWWLFDADQASVIGSPLSAVSVNGTAPVILRSLSMDEDGEMSITGTSSGAVWAKSGNLLSDTIDVGGDHDFVLRWRLSDLSVDQLEGRSSSLPFPNPSSGKIYFSLPEDLSAVDVELSDSYGRLLQKNMSKEADGMHAIDLSHLASGVYFLYCGDAVHRLIKE